MTSTWRIQAQRIDIHDVLLGTTVFTRHIGRIVISLATTVSKGNLEFFQESKIKFGPCFLAAVDKGQKTLFNRVFSSPNNEISENKSRLLSMTGIRCCIYHDRVVLYLLKLFQNTFTHIVSKKANKFIL